MLTIITATGARVTATNATHAKNLIRQGGSPIIDGRIHKVSYIGSEPHQIVGGKLIDDYFVSTTVVPGNGNSTGSIVPFENRSESRQATTEQASDQSKPIYRLIMVTEPNRIDTGATYPGCSRDNPDACRPIQFKSVGEAISHAFKHDEIPVQVQSADQAWGIVSGQLPVPSPIRSSGGMGLVAGAIALLMFFKRKRR